MFEIGDRIVYPLHGAGIIKAKETKEVLGTTLTYYIIVMPLGNIKISIPIDKMEEMGVRYVIDEAQMDELLEMLSMDATKMASIWNKRYRENMEKLKSGDIFEVAEVVRNLTILDSEKGLSTGEKKILNTAKKILISELVVVSEEEPETLEEEIYQRIMQR